MNISDEAIIAAAKVLYADKISNHAGDNAPQIIDACETVARKVLEASAPYLMAMAWDEGAEAYPLCDAAVSCGACPVCMDPYLDNPYRAASGE